MVIGDHDPPTQGLGGGDTGYAGDAVVHSNDQVRRTGARHLDDLRCQSITELETIRHQEVDLVVTECTQRQYRQRATRCTVGIEITDDQDALPAFERCCQLDHGGVQPGHLCRRDQGTELALEFPCIIDAARAIDPPQQWVHVPGAIAWLGLGWYGVSNDLGQHGSSWPIGPAPQHSSNGLL